MDIIYLIEYTEDKNKILVAILDELALVNSFMANTNWTTDKKTGDWVLLFTATKYKKEPSGVLYLLEVFDYSHLKPLTPPPLKKLRIQND
jgi:predicted type IV restriction endonuclease